MDTRSGLRIVDKSQGDTGSLPESGQALGATGFYYISPSDAWDDTTLSGKRTYSRLVTLPAYILRELLKGVVLSAAVFSVILMAVFAGQVMKDGVGPYTLMRVLPNFIPLICPFVLPLAIITGIIICYSRLSKDNEILAAYAGGVNPFWLMLPALLTSVLAIFITLTMNEGAMYPAILNIERLVIEDQHNILRRMISRPGNITVPTGDEFIAMSKFDSSRDLRGRSALDITRFATVDPNVTKIGDAFAWNPRFPFPAKRMVARHYEIKDFSSVGTDEMTIKMLVNKPIFEDLNSNGDINSTFIASGESGEERLALRGHSGTTIHADRSSFWPILMLSESRRKAEAEVQILQTIDLDNLPAAQRAKDEFALSRQKRIVAVRTAEINMRLALCFSCLAFAILGIPLGMRTRGTMVASFVWGIATAGVYFLALKSAESQVSRALLPAWTIWLPNLLVVSIGVILWFINTRRG